MGPIILFRPIVSLCLALPLLSAAAAFASDPWTPPTAEELAMTSIPEQPGAPAVTLWREVRTSAFDKATTIYVRIKVLTEAGKDYANVELPFGDDYSYDNIAGRTIHRDGSIVPFNGKPYEKIVEKQKGYKTKIKIFSLPSVEVGSILEYRYRRNHDLGAPDWFVQGELFLRSAHYSWLPDNYGTVAWTPILPPGVKVMETMKPKREISLDIQNVPPRPNDEWMPPVNSISYRVLLYYTQYTTAKDYWAAIGDNWSRTFDKFIGPGPLVRAAAAGIVAPGDTDEEKAHKIYAYVTHLENIDFSRQLTAREAKAKGMKDANSTDDILSQHKGSSAQLTVLFVALARAAGLKAYVMGVADRSERIFLSADLNFRQIDDYIAYIKLGGTETWFDPGVPFCAYGHLAWYHALSAGLRQTETGTEIAGTPAMRYSSNMVSRAADLSLDEHGAVDGKVIITYSGDPARQWRERALVGDETSVKADLRKELEDVLPAGLEVAVLDAGDMKDPEKPLEVRYSVRGTIGSATGKRLIVPADLFVVNEKPLFPGEKRETDVDMHYGVYLHDGVSYHMAPTLAVESAPQPDTVEFPGRATFNTSSKSAPNSISLFRNVSIARIMIPAADYKDLRSFYQKLDARDQDTLVLTHIAPAPAGN